MARSTFRQSRLLSYVLPCVVLAGAAAISWAVWERERQDIENDLQAAIAVLRSKRLSNFRNAS